MSSLAVSLLLLVVLAIALALFYNFRQLPPPRWFESLQRSVRQRLSGQREGAARSTGNGSPAGIARHPADRGEPTLDAARRRVDARAPARSLADDERDDAHVGLHSAVDPQDARSEEPLGAAAGALPRAAHGTAVAPDATDGLDTPEPAAADAAAGPSATPAAASPSAPVSPSTGSTAEPAESTAAAGAATASAVTASVPSQRLSEVCDCIVEIALSTACSGDRLVPVAQRFRRAGSKPVAIEVADDSAPGEWHAPTVGRHYERLRVGILLANRHGPLNAMEFSEFVTAVQAIADAFSGSASVPAMGTVLARARDLDATCAQLDAQIGVNVDAPEAIDPARLAAIAPTLEIIERGSHRYVRPGSQGEAIFSVSFSDSPNRLTFLLDVPRSPPTLDPWGQMIECASDCAKRLGARLADDGGRDLNAAALAQIARQLEQRYESLDAIGLPAGSTFALKVFN